MSYLKQTEILKIVRACGSLKSQAAANVFKAIDDGNFVSKNMINCSINHFLDLPNHANSILYPNVDLNNESLLKLQGNLNSYRAQKLYKLFFNREIDKKKLLVLSKPKNYHYELTVKEVVEYFTQNLVTFKKLLVLEYHNLKVASNLGLKGLHFDIRYFRGILLNLNEIDEDTDIFETHPEKFGGRILQVGFMDINWMGYVKKDVRDLIDFLILRNDEN